MSTYIDNIENVNYEALLKNAKRQYLIEAGWELVDGGWTHPDLDGDVLNLELAVNSEDNCGASVMNDAAHYVALAALKDACALLYRLNEKAKDVHPYLKSEYDAADLGALIVKVDDYLKGK